MQDGISVDVASILSQQFQILHSFKFASPSNPPAYSLAAVSTSNHTFLHATLDHDHNVNARFFYSWNPSDAADKAPAFPQDKSKVEMQLSATQQSLVSVEHERITEDYALSLRAINPNPLDAPPSFNLKDKSSFTGIFSVAYMQRLFKGFSMGGEVSIQHPTPDLTESCTSVCLTV